MLLTASEIESSVSALRRFNMPISIPTIGIMSNKCRKSSRQSALYALETYLKFARDQSCYHNALLEALPWSDRDIIDFWMCKNNRCHQFKRKTVTYLRIIDQLLKCEVKPEDIVNNLWLFDFPHYKEIDERIKAAQKVLGMATNIQLLQLNPKKITHIVQQMGKGPVPQEIISYTKMFNYKVPSRGMYLYTGLIASCNTTKDCRYQNTLSTTSQEMYRGNVHHHLKPMLTAEGKCYIEYFYKNLDLLLTHGFYIKEIAMVPLILCHEHNLLKRVLRTAVAVLSKSYQLQDRVKLLNLVQYQLEKNRNFVNINATMNATVKTPLL